MEVSSDAMPFLGYVLGKPSSIPRRLQVYLVKLQAAPEPRFDGESLNHVGGEFYRCEAPVVL
jgi:hypothetical protein